MERTDENVVARGSKSSEEQEVAVARTADDAATTVSAADTAASKISADGAGSLLDSCESEDDEAVEDDECISIAACGSEDYSQFVDETGRNRLAQEDKGRKSEGDQDSNQLEDVQSGKGDARKASGGGPTSPTSVTAPIYEMAETMSPSPRPAPSPPSPPPPPTNVRPDGLAFDLNQPWERSLLRQLENAGAAANDAKLNTKLEASRQSPPQNSTTSASSPPRQRRELFLLEHTESRDYAMEFDDSVSLDTNASSTVPIKAQLIHRTLLNTVPQPRVVYRINDTDDDYETTSVHSEKKNEPVERPRVHTGHRSGGAAQDQSETSSLTSFTLQTADDDRDETSFPLSSKIPDVLPGGRKATPVLSPYEQQYFLEMEPSVNNDTQAQHDEYSKDLAATSNTILPDPGCFCLGINMLDYVLPPTSRHSNASNAHLGTMKSSGRSSRLKGVMRPTRMALVQEDEPVLPEIIDLKHRIKVIRHHHHQQQQQQQKPETKDQGVPRQESGRSKKSEPEGSYMASSPADAPKPARRQRRQVVDV
jgi:hypothetical protein